MKVIFLALLTFLLLAGCSTENTANLNSPANSVNTSTSTGKKPPVLVELFTSEGCSNCPPADANLAFMETKQPMPEADLITLGFHVDYFNDRGWEDPYSSADYTRRQSQYSKLMKLDNFYTPQMVVDGQFQFVGSDAQKTEASIRAAAKSPKAEVMLKPGGAKLEIDIRGVPQHTASTIYLAIAEDGLMSEVKAGGNRGKSLAHISVVRKFGLAGKLTPEQSSFNVVLNVPEESAWKKENLKYVAFIQEDASGKIIGVGRAKAV